ncbi:hypothetical protein GB928_021150 [Shinella curvata]|uniref:DUF2125 domain-containing protein n=1 Tax=Shinella curvata TaxID=1817964 RepID=A0ABT8XJ18_9HYPH|nr:hypothetical protein [Shinella curvata]MCJ8052627.1 hypothetical protein [Shinella curvata]MDO6123707.1 hypothetical protein [Shinella curvata]
MRRQILMASAAFALVSASPAAAQEISPAGAEALQQRLTHYLPKDIVDAGLVTVKAASSFYELRFDPTVLMEQAKKGKVQVEGLKPVMAYLRPQPEGTYRVEANNSFDIKGTMPGQGSFTYFIDTMKTDGIYDPEILYFTSADWSVKRIAFSSTTQQESVSASFGESAMRITSEKKAPGTIDISSTGVMKAFSETITGGPSGRVDIGADTLDIDVSLDGARYKVFQDLVFFVLDNMHKDKLEAVDAARLKDLLRASLPVFDNLTETIKASNVTVGTDKGIFGADAVTYNIDMNGIGHSTRVGFGFGVEHPKPPAGILPAEFAEALPERANFKAAVTNLDLAGAVTYLIDHADFTKPEPLTEEQNREIGRIILPNGAMTVEFEDVSAVSPIYDLEVSGKMMVYPEQKDRHSADVTVTMRDFDKTITYLQRNAGKVPQFGQVSFGLLMMKGLARKGEGGAQIWDLTVGEDGKVLINGQPLPFQQ